MSPRFFPLMFTPQEKAICDLLSLRDREIGNRLGISEHTVNFHLRNIYEKLQVTNRVEAILKLNRTKRRQRAAKICST